MGGPCAGPPTCYDINMKTATGNEFCVEGRFWASQPAPERSSEELAALSELAELASQEAAEEQEAVVSWLTR
jgi:hypothetical protein